MIEPIHVNHVEAFNASLCRRNSTYRQLAYDPGFDCAVFGAIHRSIKTFRPDLLSPELIRQLVDLTVAAPSSFNLQSWQINLVQDPDQK